MFSITSTTSIKWQRRKIATSGTDRQNRRKEANLVQTAIILKLTKFERKHKMIACCCHFFFCLEHNSRKRATKKPGAEIKETHLLASGPCYFLLPSSGNAIEKRVPVRTQKDSVCANDCSQIDWAMEHLPWMSVSDRLLWEILQREIE